MSSSPSLSRSPNAIRWRAGSEIKVEKAVVVQIAEVRAHRRDYAVQPDLIRHILKSALTVIVIELHRFGLRRHAQKTASDFGHRGHEAGHKEIEPSVVVVIEEPRGKAHQGLFDVKTFAHFFE